MEENYIYNPFLPTAVPCFAAVPPLQHMNEDIRLASPSRT